MQQLQQVAEADKNAQLKSLEQQPRSRQRDIDFALLKNTPVTKDFGGFITGKHEQEINKRYPELAQAHENFTKFEQFNAQVIKHLKELDKPQGIIVDPNKGR